MMSCLFACTRQLNNIHNTHAQNHMQSSFLNCGKLCMQSHGWQAALYAVPEETCALRLGWICLYWEKEIPYLHGSISSCEDADSISLLSCEPKDFDFAARGMRMRIRTEPYRPERRPAVLTTA